MSGRPPLTVASMMSVFPLGTALWWGPQLTFIYNQPYAQVITKWMFLTGSLHRDIPSCSVSTARRE